MEVLIPLGRNTEWENRRAYEHNRFEKIQRDTKAYSS